jgi:CDP-glucose 4,6-dehydratase
MHKMDGHSFSSKFKGKNVIVTGHTGFKGTWLVSWLVKLGAIVTGVALDPVTNPSFYDATNLSARINDNRFDIGDAAKLEALVKEEKPDFIFHLAAQALVGESYKNPISTWNTNVIGTINLLNALRKVEHECSVVLITSDKCYENVEWIWGYKETDTLGGKDPYSSSKAGAELAFHSFYSSYFKSELSKVRIVSARAGNVIGGGDWSEGRLIPDCMKSWNSGESVEIRNPNSTRPWQHVLEPLCGYLTLAVQLSEKRELSGESFNFGPVNGFSHTVEELVLEMSKHWDKVKWKIIPDPTMYEAGLLKLNCEKALALLNWHPALDFQKTVEMTADWYKNFSNSQVSTDEFSQIQIDSFSLLARESGLSWVN